MFFAVLCLLTQGSSSPFFFGFLFSLICATLLFRTAGMTWTAVGVLAAYVVITIATRNTAEFTAYRFIVRTGFVVTMTALLIQVKIHEERLHSDYRKLADWPRGSTPSLVAMLAEILRHAADLLRAPRIIITWQDAVRPVLHIATASSSGTTVTREPLSTYGSVIDRSMRLKSFVSTKWLRSPAARSESDPGELQSLADNPINAAFRERFGIEEVVASRFTGETVSGWLFVADKTNLSADDVVLADILAGLVESRLEQFYLAETVREEAVAGERICFARNLHDGILQSLSGTALRLQVLRDVIEHEPAAERETLLLGDLVYMLLLFRAHGQVVSAASVGGQHLSLQDGFVYFISKDARHISGARELLEQLKEQPLLSPGQA